MKIDFPTSAAARFNYPPVAAVYRRRKRKFPDVGCADTPTRRITIIVTIIVLGFVGVGRLTESSIKLSSVSFCLQTADVRRILGKQRRRCRRLANAGKRRPRITKIIVFFLTRLTCVYLVH